MLYQGSDYSWYQGEWSGWSAGEVRSYTLYFPYA